MKRKILFIIWSFTHGGGAEALLTTIVNHLNPQKYDISIIEYQHADIKVEKVNANIHVLPPIERVDTPDGTSKGYQLRYTELLIEKYIRGDYDLYVSFNYQIPTFLLPKDTNNISWIHGDVYDLCAPERQTDRDLQDKAFDRAKKIVAISDHTMRSIADLFPRHSDKLIKIYNGIDIRKVWEKSQDETLIKLEHPAIVYIGRLDDNKDPERMLRVFSAINKRNKEAHLYYIGDGILGEKLSEQIKELNLQHKVQLLGYQENPFPIIRQSEVVGLLSKAEGFSMALLEALALGRPVVTTDVGAAETVTNGGKCGSVIRTDAQAVEAFLHYINIDRHEIEKQCIESVRRFELGQYIQRIEELIDEVIG
ncbi:glycosyltransferase [bacterium C-53]|nr:glycosyltransferase [Lachnospiraceae bacterium]NBI04686.1 glycosyltransferase [Lachnospiraceae bacterium]RKJ07908.1 glycosyltransferase [bacterium C-53]